MDWSVGWLVGSESRGKLVRPFCIFSTSPPSTSQFAYCTDAGATLWPLSLRFLTIIDGYGSGLFPLYTSLEPFADGIMSFANFAIYQEESTESVQCTRSIEPTLNNGTTRRPSI